MTVTQDIIHNNQIYPAASVTLDVLLNVSIKEKTIVARPALFSASTGAMITSFDQCIVQIDENSIYKNGTSAASANAFNTYKAKISSTPDDFLTLLGDVPLRPGDQPLSYYTAI